MTQLDRLLAVVSANHADELRIVQDEPARLRKGTAEHALTKQPLTLGQLMALVREVAPAEAARLERGEEAVFEYPYGDGVFAASARHVGGRLTVHVTPGARAAVANDVDGHHGNRGNAAPRGVSIPTPIATPITPRQTAPGGTRAVVSETDLSEARAQLERLLRLQSTRRASDLHLRSGSPPLLRIDGDVVPIDGAESLDSDPLERMLRAIMPERNRNEFDDLNDTDLAYELDGAGRFRVNVFRDRKGVGSVIRAIPSKVVSVEEMDITPEVQALCRLTKGLVLVTGPTGSGKSTTLCALIDLVNRSRHDHIITIEDPIEFVHENKGCLITQRQVGVHTSSFKHALRAALREDPDVVLVGELRDLETVSIAIETAETGHLVFGTLHTSTAPSTIDRIIDQFPADRQGQVRVMLSESLKGVISQTLCRKVGGGRVAAREILLATPAVSNLIREAKTFQIPSVMQTSRRLGMVTLTDSLVELVDAGKIEPKEAYTKAVDKTGIVQALKSRGHDTSFQDVEVAGSTGTPERNPARNDSGLNSRTPVMPRPGFKR